MMFGLLAVLVEFERELIRERMKAGVRRTVRSVQDGRRSDRRR